MSIAPPVFALSRGSIPAPLEWIRDVARVERILRALALMRARGRVLDEAGRPIGFLTAVPRGSRSGSSFRWDYDGSHWRKGCLVEMGGPLSLYRFVLMAEEAKNGQVDAPCPSAIERVRVRSEVRRRAPANTVLRFVGQAGRPVIWRVEDVAHQGLGFAPSADFGTLPDGEVIKDAIVEWSGRMRVRMRLDVRHVSESFRDEHRVAGAKIAFESPDDARHWRTEVDALAEPNTRADGSWSCDLWELFEHSGYFGLSNKQPSQFEHLREAFEQSSRKLARAPELGTQIVWPSVRGVEAAVSLVALNHHAIFLYHVARRRGNAPPGATGRTILRDVYWRALAWISACEYAKWLVVWVQDAGNFSKRLHLDFVRQNEASGMAAAVPFRAVEVTTRLVSETCVATRRSKPSTAWTVRPARDEDTAVITRALIGRFPACYIEALGLSLAHGRQRSAWDDSSLLRGRDVVVAERDGILGAVAILECAEDGVHLFALLDVVRVVTLGDHPGATDSLVAHAREMFAQISKDTFVFACDPELPSDEWPAGATDLGLTHCTVASRQLLPQFADHIWELTMGAAE
jgi:hypothetical protein